jgi:hypothetical protein
VLKLWKLTGPSDNTKAKKMIIVGASIWFPNLQMYHALAICVLVRRWRKLTCPGSLCFEEQPQQPHRHCHSGRSPHRNGNSPPSKTKFNPITKNLKVRRSDMQPLDSSI